MRHQRVPAVGTDHHASVLSDIRAALVMSTNADDPAVLRDDSLDAEALTDLCAGVRGGVKQQLVQDGSARAVRDAIAGRELRRA